jgi:hypothetical protein
MTDLSVHFSSATDIWSTPPELFASLDAIFCDNPFAAERSHAETCSGACRVRLHRERRAAA